MNALYMKRATNLQFRDPRELTPASYNLQVSGPPELTAQILGDKRWISS